MSEATKQLILWLIPVAPLASAAATALLGPKLLRERSHVPCWLAIALAFLTISVAAADAIGSTFRDSRLAQVIAEGFLIGGWVAMWRPLEVFLYDWWPIRAEARLFDRLSAMTVRVVPWRAR